MIIVFTCPLASSDQWDQPGHSDHTIRKYRRWRTEQHRIPGRVTQSGNLLRISFDFSTFTPDRYCFMRIPTYVSFHRSWHSDKPGPSVMTESMTVGFNWSKSWWLVWSLSTSSSCSSSSLSYPSFDISGGLGRSGSNWISNLHIGLLSELQNPACAHFGLRGS
jgi:hypothetical protein